MESLVKIKILVTLYYLIKIQKYWNINIRKNQGYYHLWYVDFEALLGKQDNCEYNLKTSHTLEVNKHPECDFYVFMNMIMMCFKTNTFFIEIV